MGFYCTENAELAKEWACSAESDGYANQYAFDVEGLSILSLTGGEYTILHWLAILLENFLTDYRKYDVIKGYRADDSYFSFATAFLNNTISLSKLERAMQLGKLGVQIVAVSKEAFERFSFMKAEFAPSDIYYPKKLARDMVAREEFHLEKTAVSFMDEVYMMDILHEADVSKFVDVAAEIMERSKKEKQTPLQRIRKARGFTQQDLIG